MKSKLDIIHKRKDSFKPMLDLIDQENVFKSNHDKETKRIMNNKKIEKITLEDTKNKTLNNSDKSTKNVDEKELYNLKNVSEKPVQDIDIESTDFTIIESGEDIENDENSGRDDDVIGDDTSFDGTC